MVPCLQEEPDGCGGTIELLHPQSLYHLPVATWTHTHTLSTHTPPTTTPNTHQSIEGRHTIYTVKLFITTSPTTQATAKMHGISISFANNKKVTYISQVFRVFTAGTEAIRNAVIIPPGLPRPREFHNPQPSLPHVTTRYHNNTLPTVSNELGMQYTCYWVSLIEEQAYKTPNNFQCHTTANIAVCHRYIQMCIRMIT